MLSSRAKGQTIGLGWLWLLLLLIEATTELGLFAEDVVAEASQQPIEIPSILTATVYANTNGLEEPAFSFKRVQKQSGAETDVVREFRDVAGKLAARERVEYEKGALLSYEFAELQTGASGRATVNRDTGNLSKAVLVFEYTQPGHSHSTRSTEPLRPDTLVADMVGPFLASHWAAIVAGAKVSCRIIVVSRKETVGFSFTRESFSRWHDRDVLLVKMQPTSILLSPLVDPFVFWIETTPPHRVLQYVGRTTPKIYDHSRWKDLEAVTVFNW